jgi:hypothetical protein
MLLARNTTLHIIRSTGSPPSPPETQALQQCALIFHYSPKYHPTTQFTNGREGLKVLHPKLRDIHVLQRPLVQV